MAPPNGVVQAGTSSDDHSSSGRWIWPAHAVFSTPSRTHPTEPFAWKREAFDRCIGIHYITRVGMAIRQPQVSIATASVYFHRFYMLQPLQDYPWKELAATALFLAIKVEEVPRKLDQVVMEFLQADGRPLVDETGNLLEHTPDFSILRKRILFYEDILLRTLTYDLAINHPYVPLIRTVRMLHDWRSTVNKTPSASADSRTPTSDQNGASPLAAAATASGREKAKRLSQSAWGFVNDSFSTPLCVIKTPETVAAAAYLLALKYLQEPIPEMFQQGVVVPKEEGEEGKVPSAKKDEKGKGVDREGEGEPEAKEGESVPVATDFATKASTAIPNGKPSKLPQTWWGAFGATSQRDVNEAANIMLDHYERSAADYIRAQARAISRPPDPSPIAIDPYLAAQPAAQSRPHTGSTADSLRAAPPTTTNSHPPPLPSDEKPPPPPPADATAEVPPPPPVEAPPVDEEEGAKPPRSIYSPKPRREARKPAEQDHRRESKRPRHEEPQPLPSAEAESSLAKTAAPFLEPAQIDGAYVDGWSPRDPPLPASLTTLSGRGDVGSLPVVMPPPTSERAKEEGREMLLGEEALRVEDGLKRDEERLANHESRGSSVGLGTGAVAGAAGSEDPSKKVKVEEPPTVNPRQAWNKGLVSYGSSSASSPAPAVD